MTRERRDVLAVLTLVATLALPENADAQRTSPTPTVRTGAVTKADVFWSDATCELKAFKLSDDMYVPEEIPPGGSVVYSQGIYDSQVFFKAYVHNRGTKRASFTTRMGIWKPPGLWQFASADFSYRDFRNGLSDELPSEAYSVSVTLESHETKVIGPFVLRPTYGMHNFHVQATTDAGNAVAESDETNNVCKISINVDGSKP